MMWNEMGNKKRYKEVWRLQWIRKRGPCNGDDQAYHYDVAMLPSVKPIRLIRALATKLGLSAHGEPRTWAAKSRRLSGGDCGLCGGT